MKCDGAGLVSPRESDQQLCVLPKCLKEFDSFAIRLGTTSISCSGLL
jgi:hypothetical protein